MNPERLAPQPKLRTLRQAQGESGVSTLDRKIEQEGKWPIHVLPFDIFAATVLFKRL